MLALATLDLLVIDAERAPFGRARSEQSLLRKAALMMVFEARAKATIPDALDGGEGQAR